MITATPRAILRLGAVLLVASLPAVCLSGVLPRASALWQLAEGSRPYWVGSEALLLYVAVPLVLLSAIILWLAPGLLLAIAVGRGTSLPVWCLSAVPGALLSVLGVLELARRTIPAAGGPALWPLLLGSIVVCTVLAALRASRRAVPWPFSGRGDAAPLFAAAIGVVTLCIALTPKLLWESFNGDGAHAFEISRLLLRQPWPFFSASAGAVASFPGTTSMLFAFPNAWFIRLFGPTEAAVRLPFLLWLPLILLGIQALAEERGRTIGRRTLAALWVGVLPFVYAMAFSASYSPYHADIALPGVQDSLLVVTLLGFCHAIVRREWPWVVVFGVLSYFGLPNGFLLMGGWVIAELLVMRPVPWRVASQGILVLVACIVAATGFGALLASTGQPLPGGEYGFSRTIAEALRLDLTQWRRLGYLVVGGAGFPVATLLLWRRQDDIARRVTLVVAGYFLFFAVQARFSLHHLVPAMILPLVIAARIRPEEPGQSLRFHGLWALAAIVMLVLSLPGSFAIDTSERRVGMTIVQQVGSYAASDPAVMRSATLLRAAFPADWDESVPARSYGGSPRAWLPYARAGVPGDSTVYLLVPREVALRPGAVTVAFDSTIRLDILDARGHAAQLARRPRTDTHAPAYEVPRASLFGVGGPGTIDLFDRLRRVAVRSGPGRSVAGSP